jgi:hypothetical protein
MLRNFIQTAIPAVSSRAYSSPAGAGGLNFGIFSIFFTKNIFQN